MNVKSVNVRPGFAYTTFEKDEVQYGFSGVWSLDIELTDETIYEIALSSPGRPDSMAGVRGLYNWDNKDRLLTMIKTEFPTVDSMEELPISLADAKKIKVLLQNMKEGKQQVLGQYGNELDQGYRDEIVTFLEPRIEMGAQLLDNAGHVFIGRIDHGLREQREKPHLPRT